MRASHIDTVYEQGALSLRRPGHTRVLDYLLYKDAKQARNWLPHQELPSDPSAHLARLHLLFHGSIARAAHINEANDVALLQQTENAGSYTGML